MITRKLLGLLAAGMVLVACQKETDQNDHLQNNPQTFSEINAPEGFNFNTFKSINLQLDLHNPGFDAPYSVEIYDQLPTAGGELLFSGLSKNDQFASRIEIPSYLKRVLVKVNAPDGSSTYKVMDAQSGSISYNFNAQDLNLKSSPVSPDCNTGCDQNWNNHSGWSNINSNDPAGVYCVTGNSSGGINVNRGGVVIRICGTADFQNIGLNSGSSIVITDGSTLTVQNLNLNSSSGSITVYNGTLNVDNFSPGGPVVNHGTINVDKGYNVNNNSAPTNNGTVNVKDHFNNNSNSGVVNNGLLTVGKNANLNGSSTFTNNCSFIIRRNFNINSVFNNNGYTEIGNEVKVNGGSQFTMNGGAMLYGKSDVHFNNGVNGTNSTSLLKFDGDATINGGGSISGNLELCIAGSITNYGTILAPASLACDVYIPTTGCNAEGNGTPQIVDSDNDGVADPNDDFPNNGSRTSVSYYPAENTFATLAFEDLWPAQGDYDFNDLVLAYRFEYITNAANELVDMNIDYSVQALGAGFNNGFALELDVDPSAIQSISRSNNVSSLFTLSQNGTEAGQSKAVIPFFVKGTDELPNPGSAFVNTMPNNPYSEPDTNRIALSFNSGNTLSDLGTAPYNPFMVRNQVRGHEIHLANATPTDKMDNNLLGQGADDSSPQSGRYFVTEQNLPWAINISGSFDYPSEKEDIVSAYLKFAAWAQSGGSSYTGWFLDMNGNRNLSLIYYDK